MSCRFLSGSSNSQSSTKAKSLARRRGERLARARYNIFDPLFTSYRDTKISIRRREICCLAVAWLSPCEQPLLVCCIERVVARIMSVQKIRKSNGVSSKTAGRGFEGTVKSGWMHILRIQNYVLHARFSLRTCISTAQTVNSLLPSPYFL